MKSLSTYLEVLGLLFYLPKEEVGKYWSGLSSLQQEAFLTQAQSEGAGIFALWRLGEKAIGPYSEVILKKRNATMIFALQHEVILRRLFTFFEERNIRFALFKGTDLAYRVYPSPSLRSFGDIDIFFHPDDIDRARQELLKDGWIEEGHVGSVVHHHYAPMRRNGVMLEPHWTLSCFGETSPLAIWNYMNLVEKSACRYLLSPELYILTLARHASEGEYRITYISRLLLDCAMIIAKDGCDWNKLRAISAELGQPYAGNLLAAFPEFFPRKMVLEMDADADAAKAYRRIFEERGEHKSLNTSQVTVIRGGVFTVKWWKIRLSMLHPSNVRHKNHLPAHGCYFALILGYIKDISIKSFQFVRYTICPGDTATEYLKLIDRAEKK